MKIYTKTGDDGTTGLFNGSRVSKNSLRVNTYGTVDELNSIIGLAIAFDMPTEMLPTFKKISRTLFNLGSDFATPLLPTPKFSVPRISEENILDLERLIDQYDEKLTPLKSFILPGGSKSASFLHQARTVCRRAERLAVELSSHEDLGLYAVKFLNRLSDFLFTAARMANHLSNIPDEIWEKD
jgi:cob(I)alamin adenosyltransferase